MPQFDLGFNDGYGDEGMEPGEGSPVDHLPPPPEIGGSSGYSEIHGTGATVVGGRSSSPRLFVQAAGHPTVNQLRVWKIENGSPEGLGTIDSNASEEDLIRRFRQAMPRPGEGRAVFKVRPLDAEGREMGMEAPVVIGEHHAALQRFRRMAEAQSGQAVQAAAHSALPASVLGLMERAIDQTRASLDDERRRSRELMEQIAEERMNVAANATTSIQSMSEKMLDSESRRADAALQTSSVYHRQAADNQAAFFQTQTDLMREERVRESERAERERMNAEERHARTLAELEASQRRQQEEADRRRREEREAWERRMEEIKLENQRRGQEEDAKRRAEAEAQERRWRAEREEREEARKREERERAERDASRQRDHEMKLRQMELEQGQQREHAERMMQLQQAQLAATMAQAAGKGGGGIKDTIKEVTSVLALLGIEPGDLVQRFMAPGGGGEGGGAGGAQWADLAGKLMGTVGEVAKAKMIADAHKGRPQIAGPSPRQIGQIDPRMMPPPRGVVPGAPVDLDDDDYDDDYDDDDYDGPREPPPLLAPAPRPMSVGRQRLQSRRSRGRTTRGAPRRVAQHPPAAPQAEPAAPQAAPQAASQTAPQPAIRLSVQRLARTALRDLAGKLRNTPDDGWNGAIMLALTSEPAIYHYCQAFSVQHAVMEAAGGDAALTQKVIGALRESPLVPDDLNYGDGGAA